MNITLLTLSLPLPLKRDDDCSAQLETLRAIELPDYTGPVKRDVIRYEQFLWAFAELHPEKQVDFLFPWAGLLSMKGRLSSESGRLTILRKNYARALPAYTELYDIHIAMTPERPLVLFLKNSEIAPHGEHRFLESNQLPLLAAAVTTVRCRRLANMPQRMFKAG